MAVLKIKRYFGSGQRESEVCTPYSIIAANTTNATSVTQQPSAITFVTAVNINAAVRYVKFYDISKTPTAGSGSPILRLAVPASTTGAGFVLPLDCPIGFTQGIGFTIVAGQADSDATAPAAGDVVLNFGYI